MDTFLNDTNENTIVNTCSYDDNNISNNLDIFSDSLIQVSINNKCVSHNLKVITSMLKQGKLVITICENNKGHNQVKDDRIFNILKKGHFNAKMIIKCFSLIAEFDILIRIIPNETHSHKKYEMINFTFEMENFYFNFIFKFACNPELFKLYMVASKDNTVMNMVVFNSKDISDDVSYKSLIEYIFDHTIPIDSKSFKAPLLSNNKKEFNEDNNKIQNYANTHNNSFTNFANESSYFILNKKFIDSMISYKIINKNSDLKILFSNKRNVIYSISNLNGKIQSTIPSDDCVILSDNLIKSLIHSLSDKNQTLDSYSFSLSLDTILKYMGILNPIKCFNEILNGLKIKDETPIIWVIVDAKNKIFSITSSINMILNSLNQNNNNNLSKSNADFKFEIKCEFKIESSNFDLNNDISKYIWENNKQNKKMINNDESFKSNIHLANFDEIFDDLNRSIKKLSQNDEKIKIEDNIKINSQIKIKNDNEIEIPINDSFFSNDLYDLDDF